MKKLQRWREQNRLTQVDAARLLGVSQPYLSLLESGARPMRRELRERLESAGCFPAGPNTMEDRLRAQMRALGYPGFAHFDPVRRTPEPTAVLLNAISQPTVDARIVEALPWLAREYADSVDWPWLVQQAKLRNLQNQLGFLVQLSNPAAEPAMRLALGELDKARLLAEATFCWDDMPDATRRWIRERRSPEAEHWNILSLMRSGDSIGDQETSD